MADLVVTNLTTADVYLPDLYCSVVASGTVTTKRAASDLPKMAGLQALVAAGTVAVSLKYNATEESSGLAGEGAASVSATAVGPEQIIRVVLVAATTGSADDVVVYAVNTLPSAKLRVMDAYAYVSAGNSAGRTLSVYSGAGGTGTLCAVVDAAAAGRAGQTATVTATSVLTNGASVGLFIRRSDRAVAGEVFITVRPEQ